MLTVKTYVSNSKIHGKGCFAARPIKKDDVVWTYSSDETFDKKYDYLEWCGWYDTEIDMIIYPADHARYINHSETPNTYVSNGQMKALRDIKEGEEITENYREYMTEDDIKRHLGD